MGGFPVPGLWPGGWRPRWLRHRRRGVGGADSLALNLVVLNTTDLEKAQSFYEAIGLSFVKEQHGGGPPHLAATLPSGLVLELYPTADGHAQEAGGAPRLGFVVADVRSTAMAASQAGGSLLDPPDAMTGQMRAVLADPDGRRIELTEGPV